MTTFDKLRKKIKNDLNIDATDFKRLYHSQNQLTSGGLSWDCLNIETGRRFGSTVRATFLIKQKETLRFLEGSIGSITEII